MHMTASSPHTNTCKHQNVIWPKMSIQPRLINLLWRGNLKCFARGQNNPSPFCFRSGSHACVPPWAVRRVHYCYSKNQSDSWSGEPPCNCVREWEEGRRVKSNTLSNLFTLFSLTLKAAKRYLVLLIKLFPFPTEMVSQYIKRKCFHLGMFKHDIS